MKNPKISIISTSYNHEKYISYFIESILNQTYQNFELIIIDDKSNDNNVSIAKSYKDNRIKIIEHKFNTGPSIAANDGILISNGEYIAFINTDDCVDKNWLKTGLEFLLKNKKYNSVCFQLEAIDENNYPIKNNDLQTTLKFKNIEYLDLVKSMFTVGNMVPSPGQIIKKSILNNIGYINSSLFQTQDYDLHARYLLKNQIFVFQKPLIKYRQLSNGSNIDNHSISSQLRFNLEMPFVLDNFLKIDIDLFNKVFKNDCKKIGKPTQKTIPYFLGIIALNTKDSVRQKWGYQTILKFIQEKNNLKLLNSLYSIEYKNIISTINSINSPSEEKILNVEKIEKELFEAKEYILKVKNSNLNKIKQKLKKYLNR